MDIRQEGDKLIIAVDISEAALKDAKPSSTGKSLMVATTNGFKRVGSVQVSLNVIVR